MARHLFGSMIFATLSGLCGILAAAPAAAADGEVIITQAKVLAGNVTPNDPAGFPAVLSEPGSYKLGSNLSPGPGLHGILATSADITIDLNGFRISGGPAGGANNARIGIWGQADRLTVKNGTIGAFALYGIYAANRSYLVVENMRIVNGRQGINNANSYFARIQNSTVATNTNTGITCSKSCHVEGNVVSGNGGYGISIESGTVLGNTILSNTLEGIAAPPPSVGLVTGFGNNTIFDNHGGGIQIIGRLVELIPNVCLPGGGC